MANNALLESRMENMRVGDVIEVKTAKIYFERARAWRIAQRLGLKISTRTTFNGNGFEISLNGGAK